MSGVEFVGRGGRGGCTRAPVPGGLTWLVAACARTVLAARFGRLEDHCNSFLLTPGAVAAAVTVTGRMLAKTTRTTKHTAQAFMFEGLRVAWKVWSRCYVVSLVESECVCVLHAIESRGRQDGIRCGERMLVTAFKGEV